MNKLILIIIAVLIILFTDSKKLNIPTFIMKIPKITISLLTILYLYNEFKDIHNTNNKYYKYDIMNDINHKINPHKIKKYNKRKVTNLQKKIIASNQNWKCNSCSKQLDYTYEVDHILSLENGGSNDLNNLQALCRNCHGKKTLNNYL